MKRKPQVNLKRIIEARCGNKNRRGLRRQKHVTSDFENFILDEKDRNVKSSTTADLMDALVPGAVTMVDSSRAATFAKKLGKFQSCIFGILGIFKA